jgi:hypothetical protein
MELIDNYSEEKSYLRAKKRAKEIKGFYIHLLIFSLSTPIIVAVNLIFVPSFHWFWFSVLGWGLGLFFHWMAIFGFEKFGFTKDWESKKIKELMEEDRRKSESL